jgi:peptide/nickel transport system ATP-binding protein
MGVVAETAQRVVVMYAGKVVEEADVDSLFADPRHPYTQRLIEAVPVPDPAHVRAPLPRLAGDVPSPVHAVGQGPARLTLYDVGGGHLGAD